MLLMAELAHCVEQFRVINQAFGELKDEQLKSDYDTVCSFWETRMRAVEANE